MLRIFILLSLCFSYNLQAVQPAPITGSWQIVSYQIIGYPTMNETKRDKWLGNVIQFGQQIRLNDGKKICSKFTYQVTTENSEAQFLIGYNIKPNQL
ncbi:MAG: hypothetical protein IMF12_01970, partial [Proteobacteria bacterium]|nr:hypothetical protein [Pseudomonadota bacterium]